ncbi:MAG: hypothetical protein EP329_11325 [Deltaproteobacteria bacterium]|nr:MAG: hypothetical protein EP329_11325 [Deltaproteobacteria bacterium]
MSGWRALVSAALLAATAAAPGCDYDDPVPPGLYASPTAAGSGDRDTPDACTSEAGVRAVFARHCTSCHGADRPDAGLDLETPGLLGRLAGRTSVHAGCRELAVVVPGRPEAGLLVPKLLGTLAGCGDPMPPSGTLAPAELQCVTRWVATSEAAPAPER